MYMHIYIYMYTYIYIYIYIYIHTVFTVFPCLGCRTRVIPKNPVEHAKHENCRDPISADPICPQPRHAPTSARTDE